MNQVHGALAVMAGLALAACASTDRYTLRPGDSTPAATGEIAVKQTKNDNGQLTVKVNHLPIAQELDPSLSTFVVWVDPGEQREPMPVGQLQIDKNRKGELQVLTPFKDFDVFVTAERQGTPEQPSPYVILEGRVSSRRAQ